MIKLKRGGRTYIVGDSFLCIYEGEGEDVHRRRVPEDMRRWLRGRRPKTAEELAAAVEEYERTVAIPVSPPE